MRFSIFMKAEFMFDTLYDMFANSMLVVVIFIALAIRLATKHPNASGGIARGIFSLFFRK